MPRFKDLPKSEQQRIHRMHRARALVMRLYLYEGATALTFDEVVQRTGLTPEDAREILDHLVVCPHERGSVLFLRDGLYRPTIRFQNAIQGYKAALAN